MAEQFDDGAASDYGSEGAGNGKKKAVDDASSGTQLAPEDPTRSTLHYGKDHEGQRVETDDADAGQIGSSPAERPESSADSERSQGNSQSSEQSEETSFNSADGAPSSGSNSSEKSSAPVQDTPQKNAPPADQQPSDDTNLQASAQAAAPPPAGKTAPDSGFEDAPGTPQNAAPSEVSLSQTTIAGGDDGAVVGTLSVVDQDAADTHEFILSDDRFEVVGGQVKLKDGHSLDPTDATSISLDITAIDSAGAQITESFELGIVEIPDVDLGSGFHASYFDVNHSLRKLDQIDWDGPATHEEIVSEVNYKNSGGSFWEGGSRDTFGAKITGNIDVEEGGTFNFHIGGDDGAMLFVNGVEVIDNDGLHGFRTRSGEVELEPGTHAIEVRYFENYGHAGLKLEWDGPGIDGRELVSSPDHQDMQTVSGMPVTVEIDATLPDGIDPNAVSQAIEGLPVGTVLQAGGAIAEVEIDGPFDITGWDTSLLTITPPLGFTGAVTAEVVTSVTQENGDIVNISDPMEFDVNAAHVELPNIDIGTGFHASYFDVNHSLREVGQIDWDSDPTYEEIVADVNYTNSRESFWEGGSRDTFGAKITGEINVEDAGNFNFYIGGDDGVVLFIDGHEVIDNDGLHGFQTRSGGIELEEGTHTIEVRYFENYGHAGLKLEWEGPGIDGRELVKASGEMEVAENETLQIRIDGFDAGDASDVTMSGLPADTILVSGEHSAVSDGGDLDLSGWDLDLIEISPPLGFEGQITGELSYSTQAFNGARSEITQDFQIDVGDVDTQSSSNDNSEEVFMSQSQSGGDGGAGWTGADDSTDSENDSDDVLQEDVSGSPEASEGSDNMDSYERYDW